MRRSFTAVFKPIEDGWWFATTVELPSAITQGKTLEEARENLIDAIDLSLQCLESALQERVGSGRDVLSEELVIET